MTASNDDVFDEDVGPNSNENWSVLKTVDGEKLIHRTNSHAPWSVVEIDELSLDVIAAALSFLEAEIENDLLEVERKSRS